MYDPALMVCFPTGVLSVDRCSDGLLFEPWSQRIVVAVNQADDVRTVRLVPTAHHEPDVLARLHAQAIRIANDLHSGASQVIACRHGSHSLVAMACTWKPRPRCGDSDQDGRTPDRQFAPFSRGGMVRSPLVAGEPVVGVAP